MEIPNLKVGNIINNCLVTEVGEGYFLSFDGYGTSNSTNLLPSYFSTQFLTKDISKSSLIKLGFIFCNQFDNTIVYELPGELLYVFLEVDFITEEGKILDIIINLSYVNYNNCNYLVGFIYELQNTVTKLLGKDLDISAWNLNKF